MKGDVEVVLLVLFALGGFFIGNALALNGIPEWVGPTAALFSVVFAAVSAWRSERAAEASQNSAQRSYELELLRSYPVLRVASFSLSKAFYPARVEYHAWRTVGDSLVVLVTLKNVGGISAVLDRIYLYEGNHGQGVMLRDFTAYPMPNGGERYCPGRERDSVVIDPGHTVTVGGFFLGVCGAPVYRVEIKSESFPSVVFTVEELPDGNGWKSTLLDRRQPAEILKHWIDSKLTK